MLTDKNILSYKMKLVMEAKWNYALSMYVKESCELGNILKGEKGLRSNPS